MNNVSIGMLDGDPAEIAELPPGVLNDLHWMLAEEAVILKRREAALHGAFERRWGAKAAEARLAEGKDTGSIHLQDGEYDVTITAPKRVKWDQAKLKAALDQIAQTDPDLARTYAKVTVAIEERKFEAAPTVYRELLSRARTVETGKTSFALSPLKEMASCG